MNTLDPLPAALTRTIAQVEQQGFALMPGAKLRPQIELFGTLSDWDDFSASWNDLHIDPYMADGGRYRRRRHACFSIARDADPQLAAPQAHYQSRDYNRLNGGIARWFEPIAADVCQGDCMPTLLRFGARLFEQLSPETLRWHCEVHQFRIEASDKQLGQPTPEGSHRDGVDFVLVLLIQRQNIASGTTQVFDANQNELGCFTLAQPLDAAIIDDHRIFHGVTPVTPLNPQRPSYRDVLVITYRATADQAD